MSFWRPRSVEDEPVTNAYRWEVYKCTFDSSDRVSEHIVCWCGEGRTSSRIAEWDPDTRIATTRSGRKYLLPLDEHGFSHDAHYVFGEWCRRNQVVEAEDVTRKYLND